MLADGVRSQQKNRQGLRKVRHALQGQELPAHDPKFATELAITYKLDATPAAILRAQKKGILRIDTQLRKMGFSGRGELHKIGSNAVHIVNSTGMCAFAYGCFPSIDTFTQSINAVTGWETTLEELLKTGSASPTSGML